MCFDMCKMISRQIMPAGERKIDLCLSLQLLQEVQASEIYDTHTMSTKYVVVLWSLGNKFYMNARDRSSAVSLST